MVDDTEKDYLSDLENAVKFLGEQAHSTVDAIYLVQEQTRLVEKKTGRWIKATISVATVGLMAVLALAVYIIILLGQSKARGLENQKLYNEIRACLIVGSECYDAQTQDTSENTLSLFLLATDCFRKTPDDISAAYVCVQEATGVEPPR